MEHCLGRAPRDLHFIRYGICDDLTAWENEHGPVSRKQAKARLKYLNSELAHEDYHDGWTVKGMKEEKEWLEKELKVK